MAPRATTPPREGAAEAPAVNPTPLDRKEQVAAAFLASEEQRTPATPDANAVETLLENQQAVQAQLSELLRKKAEEAAERRRAFVQGRRLKPVSARSFTQMDNTAPVHSDGTPVAEPGYVTRWVRTVDSRERDSAQRAGEFRHWGAEVVPDRVTGKPIISEYGLLMKIPVEQEAERQAHHAAQVVPLDEKEAELEAAVAQINRESGRQVLTVIRDRSRDEDPE